MKRDGMPRRLTAPTNVSFAHHDQQQDDQTAAASSSGPSTPDASTFAGNQIGTPISTPALPITPSSPSGFLSRIARSPLQLSPPPRIGTAGASGAKAASTSAAPRGGGGGSSAAPSSPMRLQLYDRSMQCPSADRGVGAGPGGRLRKCQSWQELKVAWGTPTLRSMHHKKRSIRWLVLHESGSKEVQVLEKRQLIQSFQLDVPLRDMRLLDNQYSNYETLGQICIRERAIVFSMEHVKLLIMQDKVVVPLEEPLSDVKRHFIAYLESSVRDRALHTSCSASDDAPPQMPAVLPVPVLLPGPVLKHALSSGHKRKVVGSLDEDDGRVALLDVENLLESYFTLVDSTEQRLLALGEYIDDTEDLINIQLDYSRNKLIKFEIILTTGTFAMGLFNAVAGMLGENLHLPPAVRESVVPFLVINVGMVCLCMLVFFVIMRNLALRKML